jgi:hypothetical protein
MGRFLRLLMILVLMAYVVGRFEPNFRSVLNTINTAGPGHVSHSNEAGSERSNAEPLLSVATFHGCGMEGDAQSLGVRARDRLKNRYTAPSLADMDSAITLEAILAPGNDISRWKVKEGAEIIGYVSDVKRGGIESTNCHARDDADRDTHIELVLDPMQPSGSSLPMIVEVTPRWRYLMSQHGIDWTTRALQDRFLGRRVKVRGWMLFDTEHQRDSENTAPGRAGNWRATAWEIHPVTSIELIARPR